MRTLGKLSILLAVSGSLALGFTIVSATPRHASSTEQDHAAPAKPAKPTANQAPPIPPVESSKGAAKSDPKAAHAPAAAAAEATAKAPTADESLVTLTKGNARWVSDKCVNPNDEPARRASLSENGQHPFATILTCSDSRLPAERVFDCGVGDIFVIRVAGNVMGVSETGTIEYGIEHLHTQLLVVMGHSKCGAVNASVKQAQLEGSLAKLVDMIDPAVERAHKNHPNLEGDALLPEAIRENVWQAIFDLLKTSEVARHFTKDGKVKIVGAICDISTGKVEFLGEHPWQAELLSALGEPKADETEVQTATGGSEH